MRLDSLELSFSHKKLRDLCYSEFLAKQTYGPELAQSLRKRIADLAAVHTASELFHLPGKPQELAGDRQGQMAIELNNGFRLYFKSGHLDERTDESGKTDWSRVRRIKLIDLEAPN